MKSCENGLHFFLFGSFVLETVVMKAILLEKNLMTTQSGLLI
jgi:hypothetical protein